jgi:hypothetical protein
MNRRITTSLKWLCVEAVILGLWWIGPGNDEKSLSYKTSMLVIMHAYLIALVLTQWTGGCGMRWRERRDS